jgi:hypothetical protein
LHKPVERLRSAVGALQFDDCELLVMLSPHGRASGVYSGLTGALDGFGVRGKSVTSPAELAVAEELARAWERPSLAPPVDHGITGALLLSKWARGLRLVAVSLAATTGPGAPSNYEKAIEDAHALADALTAVSSGRRIGFVASAHTSAALSPAAPLLDRPEGHALEESVFAALRQNPVELSAVEPELWRVAGACGAGPLSAFGRLFAGRRAERLAYETPAGVGYLVAEVVGA